MQWNKQYDREFEWKVRGAEKDEILELVRKNPKFLDCEVYGETLINHCLLYNFQAALELVKMPGAERTINVPRAGMLHCAWLDFNRMLRFLDVCPLNILNLGFNYGLSLPEILMWNITSYSECRLFKGSWNEYLKVLKNVLIHYHRVAPVVFDVEPKEMSETRFLPLDINFQSWRIQQHRFLTNETVVQQNPPIINDHLLETAVEKGHLQLVRLVYQYLPPCYPLTEAVIQRCFLMALKQGNIKVAEFFFVNAEGEGVIRQIPPERILNYCSGGNQIAYALFRGLIASSKPNVLNWPISNDKFRLLAMTVLYSDGYFQTALPLTERHNRAVRFFQGMRRLPVEIKLQMCNLYSKCSGYAISYRFDQYLREELWS